MINKNKKLKKVGYFIITPNDNMFFYDSWIEARNAKNNYLLDKVKVIIKNAYITIEVKNKK